MSKHIIDTMQKYMEECFHNVKTGNKKGVIQVLNDMKNFYMVENDMKVGKKESDKKYLDADLISPESLKAIKEIKKNIQKHNINAIGKEIPDPKPVSDKPIRHVIY